MSKINNYYLKNNVNLLNDLILNQIKFLRNRIIIIFVILSVIILIFFLKYK